jgi:HD domain
MTATAQIAAFSSANPHALAIIMEASETRRIIASRDIFDISGTKLWAGNQPVSASLQRKLLDRQLRNPLETCLMAEDGVTPQLLAKTVQAVMDEDTALAQLVRPHAPRLMLEAGQLPLHPVAQLMLTAAQTARPESFAHSLQAMAVAGALMLDNGGSVAEVRLAMLGGLLHDLGEMYIDPRHGEADADRTLDFTSYQQLVVHPHVGQLLISQLTNYPAALARAVGEHHERMDGSGYPHALKRESISPLGRLLAVAEAACAVLRGPSPYLARVSVALRVVPSEFDLTWVRRVSEAVKGQPALHGQLDTDAVQARLSYLDAALHGASASAAEAAAAAESQSLKDALALIHHLLGRLRLGWNASGLWSVQAIADQDAAEVEAVEDELCFRLRSIERSARLTAGQLPPADAERLDRLCSDLRLMAS